MVSEEYSQVGDSGGKGGQGLGKLVSCMESMYKGPKVSKQDRSAQREEMKMKMGRLTDNWI